jgi:hypothetical protein
MELLVRQISSLASVPLLNRLHGDGGTTVIAKAFRVALQMSRLDVAVGVNGDGSADWRESIHDAVIDQRSATG